MGRLAQRIPFSASHRPQDNKPDYIPSWVSVRSIKDDGLPHIGGPSCNGPFPLQIKVIMGWKWPRREFIHHWSLGLFSYNPSVISGDTNGHAPEHCWAEYDSMNDKYVVIGVEDPTHYIILP